MLLLVDPSLPGLALCWRLPLLATALVGRLLGLAPLLELWRLSALSGLSRLLVGLWRLPMLYLRRLLMLDPRRLLGLNLR